jgi:hypothetical protein
MIRTKIYIQKKTKVECNNVIREGKNKANIGNWEEMRYEEGNAN